MQYSFARKTLLILAIVLIASVAMRASWADIPLDKLAQDTDLIVVGTLHSESESDEGIGEGYILIEEIIRSNSITKGGESLKTGENLKIRWQDNWACAGGMHMRRVGKQGIWLLKVNDDRSVDAGYPGRFLELGERADLDKILKRISRPLKQNMVEIRDISAQNYANTSASPELRVSGVSEQDNWAARVLCVLFLSIAGYWFLYRSRFRIR